MTKNHALLLAVAFTASCGVPEQRRQEAAQHSALIAASERAAIVSYGDPAACAKAFAATKVYVMDKADMRIQISDDTLIATYGATRNAYVSMSAARRPDGDGCVIALNTRCRGESDINSGGTMALCRVHIVEINEGYRAFVERAVGRSSR